MLKHPQRIEMIYFETGAIDWADNSQSSAISLFDSAYHTIELSVDATSQATVRVDGVVRLTRMGFVSNGTLAVGDQSNDPNVDGTMRIRSIIKVCQ